MSDILSLSMDDNHAGVSTVGEYLAALLTAVICDGEGFSGKRPFGESGWSYELFLPLVKAGLVKGTIDPEYGYINTVDDAQARTLLISAVTKALTNLPE